MDPERGYGAFHDGRHGDPVLGTVNRQALRSPANPDACHRETTLQGLTVSETEWVRIATELGLPMRM